MPIAAKSRATSSGDSAGRLATSAGPAAAPSQANVTTPASAGHRRSQPGTVGRGYYGGSDEALFAKRATRPALRLPESDDLGLPRRGVVDRAGGRPLPPHHLPRVEPETVAQPLLPDLVGMPGEDGRVVAGRGQRPPVEPAAKRVVPLQGCNGRWPRPPSGDRRARGCDASRLRSWLPTPWRPSGARRSWRRSVCRSGGSVPGRWACRLFPSASGSSHAASSANYWYKTGTNSLHEGLRRHKARADFPA